MLIPERRLVNILLKKQPPDRPSQLEIGPGFLDGFGSGSDLTLIKISRLFRAGYDTCK